MVPQHSMVHSVESATLADILERVLDKGIVISGDIKIKLVDIELLTIQIRLVICSVDKAREMGIDWWVTEANLNPKTQQLETENQALRERLEVLEGRLPAGGALLHEKR